MKRPMVPVLFLILLPVSIGAGILGGSTVGEILHRYHGETIGAAFGLLTFATLGWFLFFSEGHHRADTIFGSVLVICGTLCILLSLGLQFYLAALIGDDHRRLADLLLQKGGNVNLNVPFPDSIQAFSYLALFTGAGLAALGIRIATGRERILPVPEILNPPPRPRPSGEAHETGYRSE